MNKKYKPNIHRSDFLKNSRLHAKHLIISCLLVLALDAAQAEDCSIDAIGQADLVEERGHYQIPVIINKNSQMQFIVDTGAESSSIDVGMAAHLALPDRAGRYRRMTGTDGRQERAYPIVTIGQLDLANLQRLDFPMATANRIENGKPSIRGIIGADLLAQHDLELDYPGRRLSFYHTNGCNTDSKNFPPWTQPYDTVPIKLSGGTISFPISVDGKILEMVLDTGAMRTKISMTAAVAKLGLDIERLRAEAPPTISYSGNGTAMENYAHRANKIQIGASAYGNIEIKISEINVAPYDGLLGLDFLRSRKIWVSYATRQLFVSRDSIRSITTQGR